MDTLHLGQLCCGGHGLYLLKKYPLLKTDMRLQFLLNETEGTLRVIPVREKPTQSAVLGQGTPHKLMVVTEYWEHMLLLKLEMRLKFLGEEMVRIPFDAGDVHIAP